MPQCLVPSVWGVVLAHSAFCPHWRTDSISLNFSMAVQTRKLIFWDCMICQQNTRSTGSYTKCWGGWWFGARAVSSCPLTLRLNRRLRRQAAKQQSRPLLSFYPTFCQTLPPTFSPCTISNSHFPAELQIGYHRNTLYCLLVDCCHIIFLP